MSYTHQYSLPSPLMYPTVPGTTSPAVMFPGSMMAGHVGGLMAGHAGGLMPPMMYTAEQLMWIQQTYAQYMAHYMQ